MNKDRKPIGLQRPLTEAEKKQKATLFIAQKREQFSISILNGLCTNMGMDATNAHAKAMVELSVEMADRLIERLYIPEEKKAE